MPALSRRGATGALAAVCGVWIAVVWSWDPAYLTLTVDDAFYYQVIARRLASGEGFTFDGFEETNGFHPLWVLVLAGLARLVPTDAATFMRATLTLQVMLVLAGTLVAARACRAPRALLLVSALALASFYATKVLVNGQESALAFFLLCATFAAWWSRARPIVVGVLAAALVLARLEAIVVGLVIACMPFAWPDRDEQPRAALAAAVAIGGPVLVAAIAYVGWSAVRFDLALPISALLKTSGAAAPTPTRAAAAIVPWLVLAAAAGFSRRRHWRVARELLPLASYPCVAVSYAWLRGLPVPEVWQLVPVLTLILHLAALLVGSAPSSRLARGVLVTGAALHVAVTGASWSHRLDPASYAPYVAAREAGRWLARSTPESAVVAGWDCGIAAAHAERRVVHLEGLVASADFERRYVRPGRLEEALDTFRVDYIVQPLARAFLSRSPALVYDGVALGDWHVASAMCVSFEPALSPSTTHDIVQLVLRRGGDGPTLAAVRSRPCEGSAR